MGEQRRTDTAITGEPGPWRSEDKSEAFVCFSFSSQLFITPVRYAVMQPAMLRQRAWVSCGLG